MPNGTYGGVRGRLISPYSIFFKNSQKYVERKKMKMAAIFNSLSLIIYVILGIIIIGYAYLYILILQASGKIGANSS